MSTWITTPTGYQWGDISNREAKQAVGRQLAQRLNDGDVVGVGSGSTVFVALAELAERARVDNLSFTAIPASIELGMACQQLGIRTTSLEHARPDWSFDGADEVDPQHRLIKGRGGALFKEKMVMAASLHPIIVVDSSKMVDQLGSKFPVPVEVDPWALMLVTESIAAMPGVREVALRKAGTSKDGPVLTERGNALLDVHFDHINDTVNRDMILTPGVIDTGIFDGFDLELMVA